MGMIRALALLVLWTACASPSPRNSIPLLLDPSPGALALRGRVTLLGHGVRRPDASGVVLSISDQPLPPGPRPKLEMAQDQGQFAPHTLVVPVGTQVSFPNNDAVEHNVFSPSPGFAFDLGRGGGQPAVFERPGIVDIYCNIHPAMVGHLVVVGGPWAISRADGSFEITGLRPGPHQLIVWDPLALPSETRQRVEVTAESDALDLILNEEDREPQHSNKYGGAYRGTGY